MRDLAVVMRDGNWKVTASVIRKKCSHEILSVTSGNEIAYVVVFANRTAMEEDIVFTESDIKNLILSKGAVYAGFTVLLNQAGIDFSMVDRVFITGGFGQYLNIEKAVSIGLLPDIDREKFHYLGNSSIAGA